MNAADSRPPTTTTECVTNTCSLTACQGQRISVSRMEENMRFGLVFELFIIQASSASRNLWDIFVYSIIFKGRLIRGKLAC